MHSKALSSSVDGAYDQVRAVDEVKRKRDTAGPCDASTDADSNAHIEDSDVQFKTIPSKSKTSSDSSENIGSESRLKGKPKLVKASSTKEAASTNSELKVENTSTRVTKKRRTDSTGDKGNSVVTAVDVTIPAQEGSQNSGGTNKGFRTATSNRFSRVKSSNVHSVVDNSYVSKVS